MPYELIEIDRAARTPDVIALLVGVWEKSVKTTHDFLSGAAIAEIKKYVPTALLNVSLLIVACGETGAPAARAPLYFAVLCAICEKPFFVFLLRCTAKRFVNESVKNEIAV